MTRDVKSRSQRRLEKKQALVLLVLMLAVSLVSFSLGVMVGKGGSSPAVPPIVKSEPARIQVAKEEPAPAVPPAAVSPAAPVPTPVAPAPQAEEESTGTEKPPLTFFDTLPKGQDAPLGSGINRPPTAPAASPDAPSSEPQPAATAVLRPTGSLPASAPAARTPAPVVAPAPAPARTAPTAADGRFVVQVGSFRSAEDARNLSDRLKTKNFPAFVQQADLGDKGTWYRVRIGPYAESADAQSVVARLKSEERIDAFVAGR
ncbi:SPOR domain-containing protein [Geoalkalibacter sp.]|uniref:SPOR domain-containing protein n=1 Tax=Geoalkalibacter sp. TaxID=3041440 RepID=UPI00272DD1A3|nr:SPOR domain-containing protein [Geoalkalibacter sp.]